MISVVAPMFNASRYLSRFLQSLYAQSSSNWRLILIDDVSNDDELSKCKDTIIDFINFHKSSENKIVLLENISKMWEVANVLSGLKECDDNDIIARIDPDDYLCDLNAFSIIEDIYKSEMCDTLWTMHRWFDDNAITSFNISKQLPASANPYVYPWVTSHLKTFKKSLLNDVNDQNFRGADGNYIRRAGDQAIYLPALYKSKKRIFLPLVTYAYRCSLTPETFQTEDAKFQASEAEFLRKRGFVQ